MCFLVLPCPSVPPVYAVLALATCIPAHHKYCCPTSIFSASGSRRGYRARGAVLCCFVTRMRRKTALLVAANSHLPASNAVSGLGPVPVVGEAHRDAHLATSGRGGHMHGEANGQADALRVEKVRTYSSREPPENRTGKGFSGPQKTPGIWARNLAHSSMRPHKAVPFFGPSFRPWNSKTRGEFSCFGDGRGPPLSRAAQPLQGKRVSCPRPRPQLTPRPRPSPHPLLAGAAHATGPPKSLAETLPAPAVRTCRAAMMCGRTSS